MANYQLKIFGWELNASAHSITDQEVEDIKQFQEDNGYDDLSEMAWDLESVVEGYEPFSTNMWVMDKPMDNDALLFVVTDEDETEICRFELNEMTDHYEIEDNYESVDYQGYPVEGKEENILLFLEEGKGLVYGFNFESDEVPTPKDFSYIPGTIGTPEQDWDIIDKVFFKGKELEVDYDFQGTVGKALTVEIWTLNDIN
jgi:hypothetical protein